MSRELVGTAAVALVWVGLLWHVGGTFGVPGASLLALGVLGPVTGAALRQELERRGELEVGGDA